jgi:GH25 family lysozyme M1 (1,4-beta-N-acetylmuramidase)
MTFIDISRYNGVFDWNRALAAGVTGTYIKSSEGLYTDSLFRINSASCPVKWRGAYHFLAYGTGASGARQAEYAVNLIKDWRYNLPVALDIEPGNGYDRPFVLEDVLNIAMDFVRRYRELTGHYPTIYASSSRTQYMGAFTMCPLWVAHYTSAAAPRVYGWSDYALWQYSSEGSGAVYGNAAGNAYIDLNRKGKPVREWAIGEAFIAPEQEPGVFQAQCTADRLIIRSAPYVSTETDTGKRLLLGDIREVTAIQGDWYRIAEGWVSSLYMARITEPIEPEPEPEPLTLEQRVDSLEERVTKLEAE